MPWLPLQQLQPSRDAFRAIHLALSFPIPVPRPFVLSWLFSPPSLQLPLLPLQWLAP